MKIQLSKLGSRKIFLIILVVVAIFVWGNFFFRINKNLQKDKIQDSTQKVTNKETTAEDDFTVAFSGKFRDPFAKTKPIVKQQKKEQRKIKRDKTPPITLRGIVGKTAMLEMKNKLYFVQEGDSLNCFLIQNIYPDSLQLRSGDGDTFLKVVEKGL